MESREFEMSISLPEGAIINGAIVLVSYFDADGQLKYATTTNGEMNLAQALGLLVLGGITIHNEYTADEPYEPDQPEGDDDDANA